MSISKYIHREVITLPEEASIYEAIKIMKNQNIGAIVILKNESSEKIPAGILTDRDIVLNLISDNKVDETNETKQTTDFKNRKVREIVTKNLLTIKENQGMKETIEAMSEKGVRRLPVVDEQGKLAGIVTLDDLFLKFTEKMQQLGNLLKKQMKMN